MDSQETPSPSIPLSVTPLLPNIGLNAIEADIDDIEDMVQFLESGDETLHAQYVRYPKSLAHANLQIVQAVEHAISTSPRFTPNVWHATDFKLPEPNDRKNLHLLVNFLSKEDAETFAQLRFIPLKLKDSVQRLEIIQPTLQFKEVGPNAYPVILFKKVPDTHGIGAIRHTFTSSVNGKPPFLADLINMQWLQHKNGIGIRKILIAKAIPPLDDLDLTRLPGYLNLKHKGAHLGEYVLGCTRHVCGLCGRKGHNAVAHDSFVGRGTKRSAPERPPTLAEAAIMADDCIVLDQGKTSREAWTCSICRRFKVGNYFSGSGFFGAYNHIRSAQHQATLKDKPTLSVAEQMSVDLPKPATSPGKGTIDSMSEDLLHEDATLPEKPISPSGTLAPVLENLHSSMHDDTASSS